MSTAVFGFAIVALLYAVTPKSQRTSLKFLFGPTPRDYVRSGIVLGWFFGGIVLSLFAMKKYPLLDERSLWVMCAFYVVAFAAAFWVVKNRVFPAGVPPLARVFARAGWALAFTFSIFGIVLIANGYATPLETRSAQLVRKEVSREHDPSHRQYRLYVLAWPGSDRVTQVDSSETVYDRAQVGRTVQLTLGQGRLGLEWVNGVSVLRGVP